MSQQIIDLMLSSALIGAISFFYGSLLSPGNMLGRLGIWLEVKALSQPLLFKPLGACIYCFNGQVALWYSVWLIYHGGELQYSLPIIVVSHLFLISYYRFLTYKI